MHLAGLELTTFRATREQSTSSPIGISHLANQVGISHRYTRSLYDQTTQPNSIPFYVRIHCINNKAIRDGRPRPPRHQVGWDIVRRECACQISWWSVEKWRRYYILKFHGNTFRWPTTLTFDLKFWKYLSVTEYPYSMCMLSFMMIGWEMTEILHFEILRKHGQTNTDKHTHTHTHKQTDMGITIPRPPPMGGEVIIPDCYNDGTILL